MSFRSLTVWSLCFACLASGAPLLLFADPKSKSGQDQDAVPAIADKSDAEAKSKPLGKSNPANKNALKNQEMNAEREQAALDFVAQNHPKLAKLITPLKTSNPKEYLRAVKELYRTSERLAGIRLKDSDRYELELEAWKIQSHVRLLAARMAMEDDPEIEQELRAMLKKKSDIQLKLLQNERDSLTSRLEQVQKQIEQNSKSQDEFVQREYDRLVKRTQRERQAIAPRVNPGKPTGNKPAGNKKANGSKPSATVRIDK